VLVLLENLQRRGLAARRRSDDETPYRLAAPSGGQDHGEGDIEGRDIIRPKGPPVGFDEIEIRLIGWTIIHPTRPPNPPRLPSATDGCESRRCIGRRRDRLARSRFLGTNPSG